MAKDPAFLFYPGDWMGGTMTLSRHQKGCYLDLLIAQFNNGPLSLETIKIVLGQDQATWTVLSSKFKQDSQGNFSNERLATEIEKRKEYCKSKSHPKAGRKKSYDKSYDIHMNNHTENENEIKNENLIRDRVVGKGEEFLWATVVKNFFNDYSWKEKFCRDKSLEMKHLEKKMQEFISDIELKEDFKELKELKSHFTNWFNKNLTAKHGSSKSVSQQKSDAAGSFLERARIEVAAIARKTGDRPQI